MATFILVDSFNMYHRAKHVAMRGANVDMKIGMAYHIMLSSVKLCYNKFNADHAVFCLEGRSWRRDFYEPYKKNRKVAQMAKTVREQEEDEIMFQSYDDMITFLDEKTGKNEFSSEIIKFFKDFFSKSAIFSFALITTEIYLPKLKIQSILESINATILFLKKGLSILIYAVTIGLYLNSLSFSVSSDSGRRLAN